ncbi:MAG: type II toxin-antitoxin system VapC family toxin [Planctomycetes bacterium]|nr:type II toxin-antitoxin system VapC family toxin [Planctomycetota bacterium]
MSRELFVDTSGFFALLVRRDSKHQAARRILRRSRDELRRLVTTDYVLDETATLLKSRGEGRLADDLFNRVFQSAACRVEWTDEERFAKLRPFFLKHLDQAWSFTDCLSFWIMKEFGLKDALTTDAHFEQAGFVALLK